MKGECFGVELNKRATVAMVAVVHERIAEHNVEHNAERKAIECVFTT